MPQWPTKFWYHNVQIELHNDFEQKIVQKVSHGTALTFGCVYVALTDVGGLALILEGLTLSSRDHLHT